MQISFRLSFRMTSAARVIRSEDVPLAMRASVPIEQGAMIIVLNCPEPDAKGARKSWVEYHFTGNDSKERSPSSVSQTSLAFSVITTANSCHCSRIDSSLLISNLL